MSSASPVHDTTSSDVDQQITSTPSEVDQNSAYSGKFSAKKQLDMTKIYPTSEEDLA